MARDRQRAKQRKARRAGQNPGPSPSEPHRANVPGELEHASGEADEFDAAMVAGAGGRDAVDDSVAPGDDADTPEDEELIEDALEADPAATGEIYEDELVDEDEDEDADALAAEGGSGGAGAVAARRRGGHE